MVYQWKPGTRIPVKAEVAGERLAELTEENGGYLSPADVVEDARPEDSPLHPAFEWDDSTAAEKYREDQARNLIRSIRVIHDEDEKQRPAMGFVHVELPEAGPAYVTTARAMSDADLEAQVIADALAGLEAWRRRHEHILALREIVAEVADVIAKAEADQRKRHRRAHRPAFAAAGAT